MANTLKVELSALYNITPYWKRSNHVPTAQLMNCLDQDEFTDVFGHVYDHVWILIHLRVNTHKSPNISASLDARVLARTLTNAHTEATAHPRQDPVGSQLNSFPGHWLDNF